jgi:hypothetical protein
MWAHLLKQSSDTISQAHHALSLLELRIHVHTLLLTQEQHCGVRCQLHADVHSLALSATDATHPLVTDLGVSDLVQTQQLQRLVHQLQLQKHRHQDSKGTPLGIFHGDYA